ncbi:hypothetical protein, variant [Aphanomyces astaci]|uniref:Uncharacterized protein n=1 Tax=Aphanomyces astaci TaxID=112090 RepID=W4GT81_APHAT|nr:hypothetical protein, variant [Aphanomyces astaci]ETV82068.1 hypothetical protein, variant [Aphanomyces astaci]|eukprot:XP_009828805.1 hypothetical protein, variant [Aphanomyces astaci]
MPKATTDESLEDGHSSSLEPLLSSHHVSGNEDDALKATLPRRRRRLWTWKHTAAFGVGGLAIGLIVLAFSIRPLALRAIEATKMDIQRMQLQYPRDDSVQLTTQLAISSDSPFGVTMHPTKLAIRYANSIVGLFSTPSMDITRGTSVHTIENATLTVTNLTAWALFAAAMVNSTTMTWTLSGEIDISLHLLSIPISNLPLAKSMVLPGMQGLRSLVVDKMDLSKSTPSDVLAAIDTCLLNPSAAALTPVGSLCFHVFYPHPSTHIPTLVGHLTSSSSGTSLPVTRIDPSHPACAAYAARGMNRLALTGRIVSSDPSTTSALISQYLSERPAQVQVTACWPHASSISLYNDALRTLRLNSTLPPNPVPLIQDLTFTSMQLVPVNDTAVQVQTTVVATTQSPLGAHSPLSLSAMAMSVDLFSGNEEKGFGTMTTQLVHVDGDVVGLSNLTLRCTATLILSDNGHPFGQFVHSLVHLREKPMYVRGSFDVVAHGALGNLTLKAVPVHVLSQVGGMDGLSNVTIVGFNLPGPHTAQGQQVEAISDIWNPSVVAMDVGDVRLRLSIQNDSFLGRVSTGIALTPESITRVQLNGQLKPQVDAQGDVGPDVNVFFSRFISNQPSPLSIEIETVRSSIPWLQQGLEHMHLQTTFPGVPVDLVSSVNMPTMHIHFRASSMHMQAAMYAGVSMPPALAHLPINITHLTLSSALMWNDVDRLSQLRIPMQSVTYTAFPVPGQGQVEFESEILLENVDIPAMAQFVRSLMFASGTVPLTIQSHRHGLGQDGVSPVVETPMGRLQLTHLPVHATLQLTGMQGFRLRGVNITAVDIVSGTSDTLVLAMALRMSNPSQVTAELDSLSVQVWLQGTLLGVARMINVTLACCNATSPLAGLFSFRPTNITLGRAFLSQFVSGTTSQEVHIQGTIDSSPNPYLKAALPHLQFNSSVASLAQLFPSMPTLVSLSKMYKPSVWHWFSIATALKVRNPFGHAINVTATNLRLYPCAAQHKEPSGWSRIVIV